MLLVTHWFSFFQPLGYTIEDSKLKRAGLDYWPYPAVIWIMQCACVLPTSCFL